MDIDNAGKPPYQPWRYYHRVEVDQSPNEYPVVALFGRNAFPVECAVMALRVVMGTATLFSLASAGVTLPYVRAAASDYGAGQPNPFLAAVGTNTATLPDSNLILPMQQAADEYLDLSAFAPIIASMGGLLLWSATINDSLLVDVWWQETPKTPWYASLGEPPPEQVWTPTRWRQPTLADRVAKASDWVQGRAQSPATKPMPVPR